MKNRNDRGLPMDVFLSVSQAAYMLGVNQETIRRLYKSGRIPVYGRPGWYRVRLCDILIPVKRGDVESAE